MRQPDGAGERGFSLLELMVALTILALAMSVISVSVSRRSPAFETRKAAAEIEGLLREARADARAQNAAAIVRFNSEERIFENSSGQKVSLPEGIESDLVSSAAAGRSAILFLPDGSSTGGAVTLRSAAREEKIVVDWLTSSIDRQASP